MPSLKIWGVVAGPFHKDEIDADLPDDVEYMLVCKVEVDGELTVHEYFFENFEDAHQIVEHFRTRIEPIEVSYG